jgi:Alpha/beta hydrolase domain
MGSYVPFDDATLDALYPDHQTYVSHVIAATRKNQADGFIDGADAAETIREAAQSDVGRK